MTTDKAQALQWFTALISGDVQTAMSLTSAGFRYFLSGTMPASGWSDLAGFMENAQIFSGLYAGPITMRIGEVTAEEDRVWLEAESEGKLKTGGTYSNTYVFLLKVRDGKVVEAKEFSDTLYVHDTIDLPHTRGPRIPRQSPLTVVTGSVSGSAVSEGMG
jgi:ketosteroid isomerase-like protein